MKWHSARESSARRKPTRPTTVQVESLEGRNLPNSFGVPLSLSGLTGIIDSSLTDGDRGHDAARPRPGLRQRRLLDRLGSTHRRPPWAGHVGDLGPRRDSSEVAVPGLLRKAVPLGLALQFAGPGLGAGGSNGVAARLAPVGGSSSQAGSFGGAAPFTSQTLAAPTSPFASSTSNTGSYNSDPGGSNGPRSSDSPSVAAKSAGSASPSANKGGPKAQNKAPTAYGDTYTIDAGKTLAVPARGVLGNDADQDGDALTSVLVSGPAHGSLTMRSDGSFNYSPAPGFAGTDSFTYRASDSKLQSSPATVALTVNPVIRVPAAPASLTATASAGRIDLAWEPAAGAETYRIERSLAGSDGLSTWTQVAAVNAPAASWADAGLPAGATHSYRVRASNAAGDSPASSVATATTPAAVLPFQDAFAGTALGPAWTTVNGRWSVSGGSVREANQWGADPVKALATGVSTPADVEVTARVRVDSWAGGDAARAGVTLGNDAQGLGYNLVFHENTNTVQFLHDLNIWGNRYSFAWEVGTWYTFRLRQSGGLLQGKVWAEGQAEPSAWQFEQRGWAPRVGSAGLTSGSRSAATASFDDIAIAAISARAPVATADTFATSAGGGLTIAAPGVLGNDTDPDGDALTAVLVAGPAHGSLTLRPDGSFAYTPAPGFSGTDSFSYAASDGALQSAPATVTVRVPTVTPVNRAPLPVADAYGASAGSGLSIATPGVLGNDTDPDGDALTAVLVSGPAHGSLTLRPDGSFAYTPAPGFSGTDSFSYAASDGALQSAPVTVALTVTPAVPTTGAYGGHPVIPNLVSIAPKVVISRTSGFEPFVVQVHAAATTASFSDGGAAFKAQVGRAFDPFLDLEFTWNFGDAAGTETLVHPVTGATVNANTAQTGPEAAYVYRTPGRYSISLTARAWTGTAYVTASTTTLQVNEIQQLRLTGAPTGGTYTLTFGGRTTAPIAHNATPAQVRAALEALPLIGAGNVRETGYGHYFEFVGALAGTDVALLTADGSGLTGGTTPGVAVRQVQAGSTAAQATCSAWAGTDRYFDSNYGGENGASDGTIDRPYAAFSDLKSWFEGGSNRRALLKRGSTFDAAAQLRTSFVTGQRVEAYGEGAAPLLSSASGAGVVRGQTEYGAADSADIVFSGVALHAGPEMEGSLHFYPSGNGDPAEWHNALRDYAFLDCTFGGPAIVNLYSTTIEAGSRWTFWRCDFYRDETTKEAGQGLLIALGSGLAIVGGSFAGGDGHIILDHHIYPTIGDHSLYRWIDFRLAESLNFCINTNARPNGIDTPRVLMDGCDFTGTQNGIDASNSSNNPALGRFDQFLVQNSAFHVGQVGDQGAGFYTTGLARAVVRDSHFWGNPADDIVLDDPATHLAAYRNRIWRAAGSSIGFNAQPTGYISSNQFVTPADASSGGNALIRGPLRLLSGWRITGNSYYAPNMTSGGVVRPFSDTATNQRKSFLEWQALGFDVDGRYVDPRWHDPANGNFRPTED